MNRTLARQLKRLGLTDQSPPSAEEWRELLEAISAAYDQNERDRYLLERSLELSSREMSERLKQNQELGLQLSQASKLASLGTLASGIAHELNNPLQAINGYLEVLCAKEYDRTKTVESLQRVLKLTGRMAATIRQLLRLSRKTASEPLNPIRLSDPVKEVFDLMGRQLTFDQIEFDVQIEGVEPRLMGDVNQLFGVFQNLVSNSRDAFRGQKNLTERKIRVTIGSQEGGRVRAEVRDTAGGIPAEVLPRIFDPFFTTKEVGSGTGLGLALAKQTVEELGGILEVRVEGASTVFALSFPAIVEAQAGANAGTIGNAMGAGVKEWTKTPTERLAVLIVDDEPDICAQLAAVFDDLMVVTTAKSAPEAIEQLNQRHFDLVITDLRMPGGSGDQIAARAREKNADIKVVMISGHMENELPPEMTRLEPFLFVKKPFSSLVSFRQSVSDYLYQPSTTTTRAA